MSTLDGQDLFGSGPHAVQTGSWRRSLERRSFAGLDGELVLDLGMRSREIVHQGRLQAATSEDLDTLIVQIEGFIDGKFHTLVDNHARVYERVFIEHFEPTTPLQQGRAFWCEYTLRYRQLP